MAHFDNLPATLRRMKADPGSQQAHVPVRRPVHHGNPLHTQSHHDELVLIQPRCVSLPFRT